MSNEIEFTAIRLGLQKECIVYDYEYALLYRDGRFEKQLQAGRYVFYRWDKIKVLSASKRIMSEVVAGQEILTSDKVEVRVSLVAVYTISNPIQALQAVENYSQQLYHDLQLAARQVVSARDLDSLLESRSALSQEIVDIVAAQAADYGLELRRIGVRDIVIPGTVRNIFLKEVEADRVGRAELVKARHEVAAARARANTAKILTENPALVRMQELDALVQLASKQGNVVLLPNLADLLTKNMNDKQS